MELSLWYLLSSSLIFWTSNLRFLAHLIYQTPLLKDDAPSSVLTFFTAWTLSPAIIGTVFHCFFLFSQRSVSCHSCIRYCSSKFLLVPNLLGFHYQMRWVTFKMRWVTFKMIWKYLPSLTFEKHSFILHMFLVISCGKYGPHLFPWNISWILRCPKSLLSSEIYDNVNKQGSFYQIFYCLKFEQTWFVN